MDERLHERLRLLHADGWRLDIMPIGVEAPQPWGIDIKRGFHAILRQKGGLPITCSMMAVDGVSVQDALCGAIDTVISERKDAPCPDDKEQPEKDEPCSGLGMMEELDISRIVNIYRVLTRKHGIPEGAAAYMATAYVKPADAVSSSNMFEMLGTLMPYVRSEG